MRPHETLHTTKPITTCPYCKGGAVTKKGTRKNKYGPVQLYFCNYCRKKFTPLVTKHKTTPVAVILHVLSRYNRLDSYARAVKHAKKKYGLSVSSQSCKNWLNDFGEHLPFLRLRDEVKSRYRPHEIIHEERFHHGQVYDYKYHRAKTDLLLKGMPDNPHLAALKDYLDAVPQHTPHDLFRNNVSRASQVAERFSLDEVAITLKENIAVETARLVLQAVSNNKRRHEAVQEFFLVNDSATVAVEVPVVLTAQDIADYRKSYGFAIPLKLYDNEIITGHIDLVQFRGGMIHILDYKPGAKKDKPIEQLMVYALALSKHTGLRLFDFKCAWFDDEDYYEFYPLQVVHKRKRITERTRRNT